MSSKSVSHKKSPSNSEVATEYTLNAPVTLFYLFSHVFFFVCVLYFVGRPSQQVFILTGILYTCTMFGLSGGYHRLWAHRSYGAALPLRLFFAMFGASAFITPALSWCKNHRAHHRYMDTDKDPMNINRGFFHAHMGWLCQTPITRKGEKNSNSDIDVDDLEKDWVLRFQRQYYLPLAILTGFVLPTVIAGLLWNDWFGGLVHGGFGRLLVVQHCWFLMNSLCHVMGTQNYTQQHSSARSNALVSFLTMGEGYQNFHQEFPNDYRLSARIYDYDLSRWIIYFLSLVGITYDLKKTPDSDVLKAKILLKQRKIDELKKTVDFGPEPENLPEESWESIEKRVKQGAKLIVVDGIVHDIGDFSKQHPGGLKILTERIGKDATIAFNGGIYRHTKAARNLAAMLRVSKLPANEMDSRCQSDDIPLVDSRFQ